MADYYKAGKPAVGKLRTIRFEKSRQKCKAGHDEELRLFYMAERKLKGKAVDGKLPAAAWCEEKARLEAEYRDLQGIKTPKQEAGGPLRLPQQHRKNRTGRSSIFSGRVYCSDCGEKLYYGAPNLKTQGFTIF